MWFTEATSSPSNNIGRMTTRASSRSFRSRQAVIRLGLRTLLKGATATMTLRDPSGGLSDRLAGLPGYVPRAAERKRFPGVSTVPAPESAVCFGCSATLREEVS